MIPVMYQTEPEICWRYLYVIDAQGSKIVKTKVTLNNTPDRDLQGPM